MANDFDERLKYADSFGVVIQLHDLIERWKANKQMIEELCFAKKIRPNNSMGEGVSNVIDGKEVFVFNRTPLMEGQIVIEDVNDSNTFDSLPNDTFFYLTNIRKFEDTHAELKKPQIKFNNTLQDVDFEKYFILFSQKNELLKERERIKHAVYSDEARRSIDLEGINTGILEIDKQLGESQDSQAEAVDIDSSNKQGGNKGNEHDFTKWMRETWIKEGRPTGAPFFNALKKYANKENSPIREHWVCSPNGAGIRYNTGNTISTMTKKNIQTMASKFRKEESRKSCQ
jgi:hypothetical protein